MQNRGSTGIHLDGASDCVIDRCEFVNLGTAIRIDGGENNHVTSSRFRRNETDIAIRGGSGHAIRKSVFAGAAPSKEALSAIRKDLSLSDKFPDREILASLHAVFREQDEKGKRDAARKSRLGKWLIEHGSDVNTAVNTLVTLAAAAIQWFK